MSAAMPCNSTEPASSATHKQKAARTAMAKKLDSICDLIENKGLDPKRFMIAFLSSPASVMATKRRYYGTKKGWNSTKNMLKSVKKVVCSHDGGRHHWNEFILEQAIDIVKREEPPRGTYPGGSYINSSKIKSDFFTDEERVSLMKEEPPDLEIANPNLDIEEMGVVDNPTAEEGHGKEPFNLTESDINQYEGVFLAKSPDPAIRKQLQFCAGTKGLDRFRPNAPGIYQLYDELEKAVSSMNIDSDPANLEVLSNHSGSEACYGDDGPEGEDEQMQRTHQITFATTQS
ncbi:hypothetical protein PSTT_15977, partial [Puccinia striiformis]